MYYIRWSFYKIIECGINDANLYRLLGKISQVPIAHLDLLYQIGRVLPRCEGGRAEVAN